MVSSNKERLETLMKKTQDILEFDKVTVTPKNGSSMPNMHSHGHYEIFFLLEGARRVFLEDEFFLLQKNSFIVLPPNCPHKMEGGAYTRINLNIPPELLSDRQKRVLTRLEKKAVLLDGKYRALIHSLLDEACYVQSKNANGADEFLLPIAQTVVNFLSLQNGEFLHSDGKTPHRAKAPIEVLKAVHFINTHYAQPISLEQLSKMHFVSVTYLCNQFKKGTGYTIGEYVLKVRLENAKFLLINTAKSIAEIAELCGFSSANYFCLIFKRKIGIPPIQYRKPR